MLFQQKLLDRLCGGAAAFIAESGAKAPAEAF
jgi:hypothetical protein